MENPDTGADSIRQFWFGTSRDDVVTASEKGKLWFSKQPQVDQEIRARFEALLRDAHSGRLDHWSRTPQGRLALIILTDQFPRNMYRGTADSFASDALALAQAKAGLEQGDDRKLRPIERVFFYLPLEHSEALDDQGRAVELFTKLFQEVPADQMETFRGYLMYALRHRRVIERFGRFPHRNAILGRESTEEETAFLQEPGSSF